MNKREERAKSRKGPEEFQFIMEIFKEYPFKNKKLNRKTKYKFIPSLSLYFIIYNNKLIMSMSFQLFFFLSFF